MPTISRGDCQRAKEKKVTRQSFLLKSIMSRVTKHLCVMGWVQVDERGGALNLLWRRLFSYRNQSIDLQSKSMDLFLYDRNLHHEIVKYLICFSKEIKLPLVSIIFSFWLRQISSQAKRGFRTLSNIYDKTLYDGRFEKIIMTGSWIPLCTR